MSNVSSSRWHQELLLREKKGERRSLRDLSSITLDFSSNDYLGFGRQKISGEEVCSSSTGSRLLSGNHSYLQEVESGCAQFFQSPKALVFHSGFELNAHLLQTLARAKDFIIYDEYIHASLRLGAKYSGATRWAFRHNDCSHLEKRLKTVKALQGDREISSDSEIFVLVESVYSMDGDLAPLREMVELAKRYQAKLIVDEAHALGVFEQQGRGLSIDQGLAQDIFLRVYPLGKGFGLQGGILACDEDIYHYMINFCSPLIYSTAPTPFFCQAILKRLQHWENPLTGELETQQIILKNNIHYLQQKITHGPLKQYFMLPYEKSLQQSSAIFPLMFHELLGFQAKHLKELSNYLGKQQIYLPVICSPTVPRGKERFRMNVSSTHQQKDFDRWEEHVLFFLQQA
jgi:8-amino-7-oxononanoate synthase